MKKTCKRIGAILMIIFLLLPIMPTAFAAEGETYVVTAERTPMRADAADDATVIGEVYKGTVVQVTQTRLGYGYVYRKSVSVGGWIKLADLKKTDADYAEDNIVGIEISLPDKLTYIVGEESFDKTGMVVCAVYANNDRIEITGYTLYLPVFDSVGAKTVTVHYKSFTSGRSFTSSFTVSVEKVPVKQLYAEGNAQTQFVEGQSISLAGLAVRVQYLDGRTDRIFTWDEMQNNPDFTFTVDGKPLDDTALSLGEHTVTVGYLYPEHTVSYTVIAVEKQPAQLQILQPPYNNTFYSDTRKPNLNGLVLSLIYTNGDTETVAGSACETVFDPDAAVPGENEIVVRYKGVETIIIMEMIEPTLVGIELADPGRTVYMQGAIFDGTNTVVNGIYNSGTKAELTNWEVYSFDTATCGEKTVELRYGEYSITYTIYVTMTGYLNGDADLDGKITAADARLILRNSVGLETLVGNALFAADRDGDGDIDAGDARLTLRASVGLEPVFVPNNNE
ncbi:MAG: bacterial Ig-like domain-containing protein [Clostridia bacterium]|nr:bacterial Ig-like domain-containing protein [Clostridia bacterium]